MDFPYRRFEIGDSVWVPAETTMVVEGKIRRTKTLDCYPFKGKIVGVKLLFGGTLETYNGGCNGEDYDAGYNYLTVTETIILWEIKRGLTNRPIYALDGGLVACEDFKLPIKWTNPPKWTEAQKQEQREEVRGAPRDANGRFMK